jgi:hypothetical protein
VPRKISAESKVNRVDICQGISEVLETLTLWQKNHVIEGDEYRIYCDSCHCGQ